MIPWRHFLRRFLEKVLEHLPGESPKERAGRLILPQKKGEQPGPKLTRIPPLVVGGTVFLLLFIILFTFGDFGFSWPVALGLLSLISVIMVGMIAFVQLFIPSLLTSSKSLTLFGLIFLIMVLIMTTADLIPVSPYLVPVAGAGMLITILLDRSIAFIAVLLLSMLMAFLNGLNFNLFFVSIIASIVGIYSTINVHLRRDITRAGLLVSITNFITMSIWPLITHEPLTQLGTNILWGIINGFLSVILTIGLLPYLESMFSLTTEIRLLELGDFNQPLLKRLMVEAPGTYHHSLLVANLAEAAADVISANSLLVRVGAYYHDIGKLNKPHYFIENQPSLGSKHEDLNPTMSSLIVISHVKDGIALARKYNLDQVLIDFIAQHHGTTLIHFFYQKALASADREDISEPSFRYPGPPPKTREVAICMLADAVEAAVRTLEEPTHSRIRDLVIKIINNKFIDGQLNECNLTLTNLHKIAESFIHTLTAVYHSRVEYPEEKELEKEKRPKNDRSKP